jgi:hypothetical protein
MAFTYFLIPLRECSLISTTLGRKQHIKQYFILDTIEGYYTRAIIAQYCHEPERLYVAFRGSKNDHNWEQNKINQLVPFQFCTNTWGFGKQLPRPRVHLGMQNCYQELEAQLRKTLLQLKVQTYTQVVFTGHSLGGSLANFAAADFSDVLRPDQIALVTYGSPRCGDAEFGRLLKAKVGLIRRQVEKNDAVTQVPGTKLGFRHVGTELYYDSQYYLCNHSESKLCSRRWLQMRLVPHMWHHGSRFWDDNRCNPSFFTGLGYFFRDTVQYVGSSATEKPITEICREIMGKSEDCVSED